MHVEQVDGVASLVAVEHTVLDYLHAEAIAGGLHNRGADAAAGALAGDDQRVDVQAIQLGHQGRAPESAGRGLAQHHVARLRRDVVDDVVAAAVSVALHGIARTSASAAAIAMDGLVPAGHARILIHQTGDVGDGHAGRTGLPEQPLDMRYGIPAGHAGVAGPELDALEQRLWLVAEDPTIEVDVQDRGALSKADPPVVRLPYMLLVLVS